MKKIISLLFCVLAAAAVGYYYFHDPLTKGAKTAKISSFEQCVSAGFPVMQSSPRQCTLPGGKFFVEQVVARECQTDNDCSTGQVCDRHICKN